MKFHALDNFSKGAGWGRLFRGFMLAAC